MKQMLRQLIAANKTPSPTTEPSTPLLPNESKEMVIKKRITRTAMGEYVVVPGEKPLTSLGDPRAGPADYYPTLNLTKPSAAQYSIVGRQKPKEHDRCLPGPSDYGTSGDLIWKKKYALKGRGKCYFEEEASKYCTVIGPAKYNVRYRNLGLQGPKYSMAHKQPEDIITGPPNSMVQPVDTHGYSTPGPSSYRPNSHSWSRGPKKSMGNAQKQKTIEGPGPADYEIRITKNGPAHSFGAKLPPPPNVQRSVNRFSPAPNSYDLGTTIGKATAKSISGRSDIDTSYAALAKATPSPATYYPTVKMGKQKCTLAYKWFEMNVPRLNLSTAPLPSRFFLNKAMDLRTNTGRTPSVLERHTSFSQLQPNHELLSPRFFADTPAPNRYDIKSSLSQNIGASMKGNRRRNFLRAKEDCSFLLPELIDGYPAPNSYVSKSSIGKGSGVSFKGKRGGPFQTNRGQMFIPPQSNERDKMSETYDTTSYVGKSSGVSFKGNRRRRIVMEAKNANAGFLLPNLIEATPGPGSYNIKSTIGNSSGVSFKGRKTGPFQSNKGATYINPELNEKETRPEHYTLASSIGASSGVSFKGNRQRTFHNAKQSNAMFLLPNEIEETPAPGFYSSRTPLGSERSVSMKGRKSGPFQSNKGQAYVPTEINDRDNNPAPNAYDISPRSKHSGVSMKGDRRQNVFSVASDESPGPGSYELTTNRSENGAKFKGRRLGPFQTTSGSTHIRPEYDDKTQKPAPGSYNVSKPLGKDAPSASFKGSRARSLFGEPVRPGPADYSTTSVHMKKDPAYTVRHLTKPSYPESLNYVSKGVEDTPGPGKYQIAREIIENESPAYSMKQQLKTVENDMPAPNQYAYEKKGDARGAKYSMGKRFSTPNSMKNNPGPGTYSPKLSKTSPKFSMKGRTDIVGKSGKSPGPNAYNIPPSIKIQDTKSGASLKSRQSPFVYSGFQTSKLMEPQAA